MENVLYAKFSNQRKKEFEISTSIVLDNERKYVVKRALYKEGIPHIQRMLRNQNGLREIYSECGWNVAECITKDDMQVEMEYVQGKTLEDIINETLLDGNLEKVYLYLADIAEKIYGNSYIAPFVVGEEFKEVFGNIEFKHDLSAFELSNVDMIFSNLLVDDEVYTVVDYEWVFEFMIPVEFILFRSLFHNAKIQKLEKRQREKLYECMHIDLNDLDIFEQMEYAFQNYVKGENKDFGDIYAVINTKAIALDDFNIEKSVNCYSLFAGECSLIRKNTVQTDIIIDVSKIASDSDLKLNLNCYNGIYKLNYAYGIKKGVQETLQLVEENSDLIIVDDYYYIKNNPYMVFKNNQYDSVSISYTILSKANNLMQNIVNALKNEHSVMMQNAQMNELLESSKNQIKDYKEAYETVSNELDAIHANILWKIGAKIKGVGRKQKD